MTITWTRIQENEKTTIHWMAKALCSGQTELFFAPDDERRLSRHRRETSAVAICAQCEVALECRTYGRENGESGIWGGETEDVRFANGYLLRDPVVGRKIRARQARERERGEQGPSNGL